MVSNDGNSSGSVDGSGNLNGDVQIIEFNNANIVDYGDYYGEDYGDYYGEENTADEINDIVREILNNIRILWGFSATVPKRTFNDGSTECVIPWYVFRMGMEALYPFADQLIENEFNFDYIEREEEMFKSMHEMSVNNLTPGEWGSNNRQAIYRTYLHNFIDVRNSIEMQIMKMDNFHKNNLSRFMDQLNVYITNIDAMGNPNYTD